jgi:hypothetical protein
MKSFHVAQCIALIAVAVCSARAQAEIDQRQRELSQGYARLYQAASSLRFLDELLLVKFESRDTERVIGQIAAYGSRLKSELEDLARANPGLSLEDDGLPLLERDAHKRQQHDRLRTLAPLKGASGADFERTLLLTQSGALNQLRFLADALAEAETSEARRAYALGVRRELDRLYVQIVELLDKRYFKPPARTPLGAAGD